MAHLCVPSCQASMKTAYSYKNARSLRYHQEVCDFFKAEFAAAASLCPTKKVLQTRQPPALDSSFSAKRKSTLLSLPSSSKKRRKGVILDASNEFQVFMPEIVSDRQPEQNNDPLPPLSPIRLSQNHPHLPSPVPVTLSGHPTRSAVNPAPASNVLPQAPPAVLDEAAVVQPDNQPRIRRVILIVRDALKTHLNPFRMYRLYQHRPSYDPDAFVPLENLTKNSRLLTSSPTRFSLTYAPPWPFANMTIYRLMRWLNTGSTVKSEGEANRLVDKVINTPDFHAAHLDGFNAIRENRRADEAKASDSAASVYLASFATTSVDIQVPSGQKDIPSTTFSIPGLHFRPILSVLKEAFSGSLSDKMHLSPFKLFHQLDDSGAETRVYGELYTSDSFIKEHDKIQRVSLPPSESACKKERVVAAIMLWSDATHLANFGTAKLWPIYLMLGNISKYIRSQPDSGACHHLAYIPSLPDSFQDFASKFHAKWKTQKSSILTHCRRELMHAVWKILLTDDFIHAYKYGIVIKCADGIERRVFPRFFTYSADYPEKVLLATIRDKGLCPCPRCLVRKDVLDRMGQARDMQTRCRDYRTYLVRKVNEARNLIYSLGHPITGIHVEKLLKESSSVPTQNAFMERLGIADFDLSKLLVVDFLHEFELGVWKGTFTHLIRLLYASSGGVEKITELDERLRSVSSFGVSTIRKFANNASEMKKLAARDFEDLLQCAIPAFEGLLPEEHNTRLMKLLYRLAEWHALAKLRMHTDLTLKDLDSCTTKVGTLLREFRDKTCSQFQTFELPREQEARNRRQTQINSQRPPDVRQSGTSVRKARTLNLSTYKFHAMADYVTAIRWFGTIDSFSTQLGELAHRLVKRLYGLTNKRNPEGQIARRYHRSKLLSHALEAKTTVLKGGRQRSKLLTDAIEAKRRAVLKGKVQQNSRTASASQSPPSHLDTNDTAHAHQVKSGLSENLADLNVPLDVHHFMSSRRDQPISLTSFLSVEPIDPAKKNFLPKLEDHLLGRLRNVSFDGDYEFTPEERRDVIIVNERIYAVKTLRINYTTYDVRRDYDIINPRTDHCTVMLRSPETHPNAHPYWYAQVLGIFHADVVHYDWSTGSVKSQEQMQFLWVRWLGAEPGYRSGSHCAKLPKVGFVPEDDDFAFGFLDPDQVIRACHLIPDFVHGKTNELLTTCDSTAARKLGEIDDWWNYYVMIFVDRDMFMRFHGGGVGHIDIRPLNALDPEEDNDHDEPRDGPEPTNDEPEASSDDSEAGGDGWLLDYLAGADNENSDTDDDEELE